MWLLLALLAALFSAVAETIRKRLVRDMDPWLASFAASLFAALALAPVVVAQGLFLPGARFWVALAVSGTINVAAIVLVSRAYQLSDLSLLAPLKGTTPIFTMLVALVLLAEFPSVVGLAGVVTLAFGTWIVSSSLGGTGITEPLLALWDDRGARRMLLVAFLFGVASVVDKVGVLASSPLMWGLGLQGTMALGTGLGVIRWGGRAPGGGSRDGGSGEGSSRARTGAGAGAWLLALGAGVATAVMMFGQMTALETGLAAYVIAVKRLEILLVVLTGGLLFKERRLATRALGALVMLAGLGMLALAG